MQKKFNSLFPDTPELLIRQVYSPYRVCPVGAHIDHQLGHVTGFAIDHGVTLMYVPTDGGIVNLFSTDFEGQVLFTIDVMHQRFDHWGRYVQAATYALSKTYDLHNGIQGLIQGSLPVGGLSSSAAVLLCYLMALSDVNEIELTQMQLIQLAFEAENEFIGLNLGKLDHSCEVLCKKDHLLYLDTLDNSYRLIPEPKNMPDFDILVFFSGLTRTLIDTNYNIRTDECRVAAFNLMSFENKVNLPVKQCRLRNVERSVFDKWKDYLPTNQTNRATHFMYEFERVNRAVDAYQSGNIETFGAVMFESGLSSIQYWEAGCKEMIALYNIMTQTDGIYGGRFSGAGFKGCCIAISDPLKRTSIIESLSHSYLQQFPELSEHYSVHVCKTSDGVRRIK